MSNRFVLSIFVGCTPYRELSLELADDPVVDADAVTEFRAAEGAGLRTGDVIISMTGSKSRISTNLVSPPGGRPDERVALTVGRSGRAAPKGRPDTRADHSRHGHREKSGWDRSVSRARL